MKNAGTDQPAELEYVKDLPGYKRTHPHYFKDPAIDHLMEIVFLLGGEVWANRDRHAVMEHLLATEGKVTPDMIEQFKPDPQFAERHAANRKAYIRRVFGCLYGDDMLPGDGGFFDWILKDE